MWLIKDLFEYYENKKKVILNPSSESIIKKILGNRILNNFFEWKFPWYNEYIVQNEYLNAFSFSKKKKKNHKSNCHEQ